MSRETRRLIWIAMIMALVLAALLAVDAALLNSDWVSNEMMMEMLG